MEDSQEPIFSVLKNLCDEAEIYVTVEEKAKFTIIICVTKLVGGLLMGIPDFVVGGAVGGLLAYIIPGKIKPVSQVLIELPQVKKDTLLQKFSSILSHVKATDGVMVRADQTVYQTDQAVYRVDHLLQNFSSDVHHLKASADSIHLSRIQKDQTVYQNTSDFVKDFITSDLNMTIKF